MTRSHCKDILKRLKDLYGQISPADLLGPDDLFRTRLVKDLKIRKLSKNLPGDLVFFYGHKSSKRSSLIRRPSKGLTWTENILYIFQGQMSFYRYLKFKKNILRVYQETLNSTMGRSPITGLLRLEDLLKVNHCWFAHSRSSKGLVWPENRGPFTDLLGRDNCWETCM